jgi:dienelactone hydrolase
MIKTESIEYREGSTACEGYFAYDDAKSGKRPGVLVVHEWGGLGDYVNQRARMLAELGYVAFGCDIFGKGVRATAMEDCARISKPYYEDRSLTRRRAEAGLAQLRGHNLCDTAKVAAIGYCFGGLVVLEMARAQMPLNCVVSFHGQFITPQPAKTIKARVLALHGAVDPVVPPAEVQGFEKEMEEAGADWQLVAYGGAKHTFTNFNLPRDLSPDLPFAYNEKADKRSWIAMKDFFAETFG